MPVGAEGREGEERDLGLGGMCDRVDSGAGGDCVGADGACGGL
ncbi:MAG: hypothetical protein Q8P67_11960 [archaeon]|nr:hypothetical protein [archaeon]